MTALSINQKKLIRGLSRKKVRSETGLFLAEGDKIVREVLGIPSGESTALAATYRVRAVFATGDWLAESGESIHGGIETVETKASELRQVSIQQEPNQAIAIVEMPDYQIDIDDLSGELSLGLETIQDPGNLGAIIRIADWFGIRDILCSEDCAEMYNPKVIQSTMGSFLRVRVHYLALDEMIVQLKNHPGEPGEVGSGSGWTVGYPVFATGSSGENIYTSSLPDRGMILLGNESRGLSPALLALSDRVLSIPHHDPGMHPESLNVAAATAVLCSAFRRQPGV